jgi:molecular chaperone DnaK
VILGLKTQKPLRPGIAADFIKIPIYQGDYGTKGSRAVYNEHVYDVLINGEDIPALLPDNSQIDLTVHVDESERISISAYFPFLDYTTEIKVPRTAVQKEIEPAWLENEFDKARSLLENIASVLLDSNPDVIGMIQEELNYLENRFNQGKGDSDRKKEVLGNLRGTLRKIDALDEESKWPVLERELKENFYRLEIAHKDFGDAKSSFQVNQMKERLERVINEKNLKAGEALLEDINSLYFNLTYIYQMINFLQYYNNNFDSIAWTDRSLARQLISKGMDMVQRSPNAELLQPIVQEVASMLPDEEKKTVDDSLLRG